MNEFNITNIIETFRENAKMVVVYFYESLESAKIGNGSDVAVNFLIRRYTNTYYLHINFFVNSPSQIYDDFYIYDEKGNSYLVPALIDMVIVVENMIIDYDINAVEVLNIGGPLVDKRKIDIIMRKCIINVGAIENDHIKIENCLEL